MTTALTGSWRMLVTSWRIDARKTVLAAVLVLAGAAAGPLLAAAVGWMTDAAYADATGNAALAGVVAAVLAIMILTFGHFAHIAYFELSELAELDLDRQLIELSNGSHGIEHHERPDLADTLTVLQRESRRFRMGLEALLNCLGLAVAMGITGILLATRNPLLLLLPLAAVPPLVAGRICERILDRARTEVAEPTRVALNLFQVATSPGSAGELRVFRLRDTLLERHARLWDTATAGLWKAQLTTTWIRAAGQLVFAVGYIAAVLLIVRDAVAGRRSAGDVVLVVVLAAQVNQQVTNAVTLLQDLQRMASTFRRLAEVREQITVPEVVPANQRQPPQSMRDGIRLEGISFAYHGVDQPVIRDLNLYLPAGSTVALVGENGAGKTTLVKLLCGFYQPTEGRILVDGVDVRSFPVEAWRERISAGFQDFVRYECSAQYAVGVGDLRRAGDVGAVRSALTRAHAMDVVERLEHGLRTHLGKSYRDGAELSGGQWQKLALGRAMMRRSPLLVVLDEPASALDAEAEHALFDRYAAHAKQTAHSTGAVTVFVSHRFSTVRTADLIIVVRDGRVVEAGDHDALMGRSGLYAELFAMQERAYR